MDAVNTQKLKAVLNTGNDQAVRTSPLYAHKSKLWYCGEIEVGYTCSSGNKACWWSEDSEGNCAIGFDAVHAFLTERDIEIPKGLAFTRNYWNGTLVLDGLYYRNEAMA